MFTGWHWVVLLRQLIPWNWFFHLPSLTYIRCGPTCIGSSWSKCHLFRRWCKSLIVLCVLVILINTETTHPLAKIFIFINAYLYVYMHIHKNCHDLRNRIILNAYFVMGILVIHIFKSLNVSVIYICVGVFNRPLFKIGWWHVQRNFSQCWL